MEHCDIEAIGALLDGELAENETVRLRGHLEGCSSCKALYDDLTALRNGFDALDAEPPDTLVPGIMYKINLGEEPPRKRRIIRSLIGVAACAAAVLFIWQSAEMPPSGLNAGETGSSIYGYDGDEAGSAGVERTDEGVDRQEEAPSNPGGNVGDYQPPLQLEPAAPNAAPMPDDDLSILFFTGIGELRELRDITGNVSLPVLEGVPIPEIRVYPEKNNDHLEYKNIAMTYELENDVRVEFKIFYIEDSTFYAEDSAADKVVMFEDGGTLNYAVDLDGRSNRTGLSSEEADEILNGFIFLTIDELLAP